MPYGIIKIDTITFTDGGIDKSVSISGLVQNPTFSGNITVTGTVSGNAIQGQTVSGVTVTGTTSNFASGVFTTQISGATVTGNVGSFTTITGGTVTLTSGVFGAGTASAPSIAFTGDLNTGIYSPGADQVAVATNGSERLRIDANGAIGLGGANYGTSGQVLTSAGSGAAPTWTTPSAGSTDKISEGNSSAEVIDTGSDGRFVVTTEGSERLRVTSAGLVGIGTASPGGVLEAGAVSGGVTSGDLLVTTGSTTARVTVGRLSGTSNDNTSFRVRNRVDSTQFQVDTSAITFGPTGTEAARIDSSGRLLVGTSSARSNLYANTAAYTPKVQIESNINTWGNGLSLLNYSGSGYGPTLALGLSLTNTQGNNALVQAGEICGKFQFLANDGTNFYPIAEIQGYTDGTTSAGDVPGRLVFSTTADGASSPTERMRIANNGQFYAYTASGDAFDMGQGQAAGTSASVFVGRYGSSAIATGTVSVRIYNNGNVVNANNSYGSLSDIKLKENIADASSQWADLKALQVRNYNFKEGQTHTQIGLIAQEVEQVSPGLVSESPDRDAEGNDLGTVTKSVNYSVLYMKAVKALQEAMERIETLEADVAALKAQ